MFYFLSACVLIFYLPTAILAIECLECQEDLNLDASEASNITRTECSKTNKVSDMCLGLLTIDFQNRSGNSYFSHLPGQVLSFSNGKRRTTTTTSIWLSKNITSQSVQSLGIDSAAIQEDIDKIYNTVKTLKNEDLQAKLRGHLYTPRAYVADLTCLNNQGQTVQCPNGFCQLADNGKAAVDRKCVSQGEGVNPLGILISSTNIEESDPETGIVYACNKGMCNGAEIGERVRQLLIDYKLLEPNNSSQTTSTMTSSQTTSAVARSHPTVANFHCLLLLITSLFL